MPARTHKGGRPGGGADMYAYSIPRSRRYLARGVAPALMLSEIMRFYNRTARLIVSPIVLF